MAVAPQNVFDRLYRAMRPIDPTNMDGPWALLMTGTTNLGGGGGAGGTSMVDNNPFTPGGTSITPMGAYVGGRQVASGNAGAPAMSASAILQVHVVAGGAGGGLSQLQIVGSDNTNFANVGYPSGGSPTYNAVPVNVMNAAAIGGAGGGFATAAVYGSPAFPVYTVGSTNIVNPVQVNAPGGSLQIVGSINPHGVFAPAGSINVVGSVFATNLGGSVGATQVGAPWSFVGSVGVTPLATFTVALDKIPTVNLGLGTVNIGNGIVGSVFAVNLGGSVGVTQITNPWIVDPRAGLVGTQWPINHAGSGYLAIAVASSNPAVRVKIHAIQITADNSAVVSFQSPSGTFLTGSIRVPGAAGFNLAVPLPGHIWIGATNATFYMQAIGSQNIGGWLSGVVE